MPKAADPKKINDAADIALATKRKSVNVRINLSTAEFEVRDAKNQVVKRIAVKSGVDAVSKINASGDVASGELIQKLKAEGAKRAATHEAEFADIQDELMKTVEMWRSSNPGTNRSALALEIGRLQRDLARAESKIRSSEYRSRETHAFAPPRRLFSPHSFDDRIMPFPIFKLASSQTLAKDRVVPA